MGIGAGVYSAASLLEHLDQVFFQALILKPVCEVRVFTDLGVMQQGESVGAVGSEILRRPGDQLFDEIREAQESQVEEIRSCSSFDQQVGDVPPSHVRGATQRRFEISFGQLTGAIQDQGCPVQDSLGLTEITMSGRNELVDFFGRERVLSV